MRRLLISALALWVATAAAYGVLRLAYGERPAFIHVRWAPAVDDLAREQLEHRYRLTRGEIREGRTWSYYLTDLSRQNIRALVTSQAAEDTHYVHRTAFRVWRTAPRSAYLGSGPGWIAAMLEFVIVLFAALGAAALGVAVLERAPVPSRFRGPLTTLAWMLTEPASALMAFGRRALPWLEARIPVASAESLALFRLLFGAGILAYFVMTPVSAEWLATAKPETALQRLALRAYEAAPFLADGIRPWLVFWSLLFIAGALARTSFAMVTVGALAWGLLYTSRIGGHSVQVGLVAMLCLLWARWGDAWSVDAWWARGRQATPSPGAGTMRGREYGYAMWMPGLVLGTSFAAAAFAKLRESGLAWISNGTVKYHFLSDAHQAPVDWGLRLGQYDTLAVLLSFGGIAAEACVIVGVLSTRYRYRLAAGAAGALLLMGFWLFQGLVWPLWIILLLSFLPWHRIGPTGLASAATAAPAPRRSRLLRVQMASMVAVVGLQVAASINKAESPPLVSTLDMYSTTYTGPADYDAKAGLAYWIVASFADGTSDACKIDRRQAEAVSAQPQSALSTDLIREIEYCFRSHAPIRSVSVEGRRRPVDWARWRFADEISVPIAGPIALELR